ncbi:MAG: DUF4440 domain-containing protein [Bacteroidetes bacterium]|nr:DUF4440 domain-containing protein [Bacteroidota bacterium]
MKFILLSAIFSVSALFSKAQNAEKLIKAYFLGYEKKDWNMIAGQLSGDFTFTSPNNDDHIPLAIYKERCWPTSKFFKKIEFEKIMDQGNSAFVIYNITTTDNKVVRNAEYYTFSNGKIKSIECFFGPGIGYPGNTK